MLFNDKSRQTVIDLTGFVAHPTHCPHVRPLPLLPRQLQPLAALLLSSKKETIHTDGHHYLSELTQPQHLFKSVLHSIVGQFYILILKNKMQVHTLYSSCCVLQKLSLHWGLAFMAMVGKKSCMAL